MYASRRSERLRVKRSQLAATDNDVDSAQQLEATRESVAKHEKQKKGRAKSAECTASTTRANDGSGTREARATSVEYTAATTGANDGSGTREARATSAECTAASTSANDGSGTPEPVCSLRHHNCKQVFCSLPCQYAYNCQCPQIMYTNVVLRYLCMCRTSWTWYIRTLTITSLTNGTSAPTPSSHRRMTVSTTSTLLWWTGMTCWLEIHGVPVLISLRRGSLMKFGCAQWFELNVLFVFASEWVFLWFCS